MSWVICAETFLAVVACSYITMVCFTHPHESRQGPAELATTAAVKAPELPAVQITEVALAATWTGTEVKVSPDRLVKVSESAREEKPEVCKRENTLGTIAIAFLVAFMAGGFMNLERIQGLPIP